MVLKAWAVYGRGEIASVPNVKRMGDYGMFPTFEINSIPTRMAPYLTARSTGMWLTHGTETAFNLKDKLDPRQYRLFAENSGPAMRVTLSPQSAPDDTVLLGSPISSIMRLHEEGVTLVHADKDYLPIVETQMKACFQKRKGKDGHFMVGKMYPVSVQIVEDTLRQLKGMKDIQSKSGFLIGSPAHKDFIALEKLLELQE